jgi:DNA-binding protein HU-beta
MVFTYLCVVSLKMHKIICLDDLEYVKLFINYKLKTKIMTKAEIVAEVSEKTGVEKVAVQAVVESFMDVVKGSMSKGNNVYLRGFGSFIVKKRAEKTGRNISKNTTIVIPAHNIPAFKPAKVFLNQVKKNVKVK